MRKAAVFLLAILLIVLPFHPFLTTFFAHIFSGNELALVFVKAWKEIFIMVISALVVLYWMFDEKRKPFDTLDYSIILFVCLSLIIGVLFTGDGFPQNIFQLMWGAKYGFLFLILFFFVRKIPIFDTERNDLINAALFSGSVVIVFGLLQASLLPEDFLVRFGYSPEYGNTTAGETLSYCHKIETPSRMRSSAECNRLFRDRINWGRIRLFLCLFSFIDFFGQRRICRWFSIRPHSFWERSFCFSHGLVRLG
jgi:hypothetical protein